MSAAPQEKCSLCHSPWLNATWTSIFRSPVQDKPSLEGRSAECQPQLPTSPPATPTSFRRPSQHHCWAPKHQHHLSFMQSQWVSARSFCAPRGMLQARPANGLRPHGVGGQHMVHAAGSSAGNTDVPKPSETESPAVLAKPSPVSAGSGEERRCCLLQALPCPPAWTAGTKHVRAALERLSPEPGQGGRGEGCYGKASPAKFLLCWIKAQQQTITNVQRHRERSPLK